MLKKIKSMFGGNVTLPQLVYETLTNAPQNETVVTITQAQARGLKQDMARRADRDVADMPDVDGMMFNGRRLTVR